MRTRSSGGIRLADVVLTVVLAGLAVYLMVENVTERGEDIRVDSHSWWMLPVFLAAVAPVLVWRRNPLVATVVAVGAMAVHVLAFGWLARCGAGLPLAWVLAFLVGTRDDLRRSLLGLAAAEVLGSLVLAHDSAAGPSLIPVVVLMGAGIWGIGRVVHHRAELAEELAQRNEELGRLRDARASLDVSTDRARLSAELDALLDVRLEQLARVAEAAAGDDVGSTASRLSDLETESRRVLAEMREVVGTLRGGEVALAPAPSVASLDALLTRSRGDARLSVAGDPRSLPASVELSAYRLVEHVLTVMSDDPDDRVEVGMRFDADAVEVTLAGRVARGADVRAALARARERVRLQQGTLDVKLGRGRARVVALLPVGV